MQKALGSKLRLLETTDLHMQLTGYDYVLDNHVHCGGLEKLSGSISALRNDGIATILCDNGDFLEGSPLADLAMELEDMRDHPLVQTMNVLEYDAIALGNHEFDYGTDRLRQILDALDAPVICANVRVSRREHFTAPWTIVTRQLMCSDGQTREIKVGLIGFVTPLQVHWGRTDGDEPLATDDILAAAMTHLPALRRAGADIAIALSHTGIGPTAHSYGMENAAYPLASLRGIDVVFLGHTHDQFPSPKFDHYESIDTARGLIYGTPAVMAGQLGEALGQIDLDLEYEDGDWRIVGHDVRIISAATSNLPPEPKVVAALRKTLAPLHAKTQAKLAKPVGETDSPISSYFSSIGYDPTLKFIAQSKMDVVEQGLIGTQYEGLPLLGTAASFRAGGRQGAGNYIEIEKGSVTAKNIAAMTPFNNPVVGVLRHGWQLRQLLEEMSRMFNVLPDRPGIYPLLNENFPVYHFDLIYGLEYTFDLQAPVPGQLRRCDPNKRRVPVLKFGGTDVLDDDLFVVATSRYRAMGGGCMGIVPDGDIVFESKDPIRDVLTDRLATGHTWDYTQNWRFEPAAGTSVLLETSPKAINHIPDRRIEPTQQFSQGFQRFRLPL